MAGINGHTPDSIDSAIVNALHGQVVRGNDSYTVTLEKAQDPLDVTMQGQVWSDGAFVVLFDIAQIDGKSVTNDGFSASPQWEARYSIEIQVLLQIPAEPGARWSNKLIVARRIVNLVDAAFEPPTGANFAVSSRRIPRMTRVGNDFYLLKLFYTVDEWWDQR